jgi:uridine phosphorylase
MTFAGAVLGGGVSILTTFLTQRYALKAQLAIKKADAETGVAAALRSEKEKRYLAITQNLDSFYTGTQDPTRKVEFLKTQRELWLLGDQELIRNFEPSWEISPRAERSLLMSASLGT